MFSLWTVAAVVVGYLALLFIIAFWADKRQHSQQHPYVYSLALGVHCTSWAFFGTVTQSAQFGWSLIPTYLGIILVMLFAQPVLLRIARLCRQHNVSSLADFISIRYQRSYALAASVSVLCFIGVIPYIALQLDAITNSVSLITNTDARASVGLYVVAMMALFALLFGTRTLSLTDKHPGLMLTIAFESVVKLVALLIVGGFAVYGIFDGLIPLLAAAATEPATRAILSAESAPLVYISHVVMGICAMFCLPRQFHINFIENNGPTEMRTARWLFPIYLCLMSAFILPIALTGSLTLGNTNYSSDTFTLALPVHFENKWIAMIAFIGGIAAATSMVIVATLALGIMIANNLLTPLLLASRIKRRDRTGMTPGGVLLSRRLTILVVLAIAYLYYLNVSQSAPLVSSGTIALALLAQSFPALLFGLYWHKRSRVAALISLLVGILGWFTWLLWPSIRSSYYFDPAPTDWDLSRGFLFTLALNAAAYAIIALIRNKTQRDRVRDETPQASGLAIRVSDLTLLASRILPAESRADIADIGGQGVEQAYASQSLVEEVEKRLTAHVGSAGARILLSAITEHRDEAVPDLVEWMEEARDSFQFNHEVLQSSLAHIEQGICVVDTHLRIVAWNERYLEMFHYPEGFVQAGKPIGDIIRFNVERGLIHYAEDKEVEVAKRLDYLKSGSKYRFQRTQKDGTVIEISGSPLPGGGFVTSYSDITEYVNIQAALQRAKDELEQRVEQRTAELNESNQMLAQAKQQAEAASASKTRFLAAAGHDLMQPFNAATLFAGMLAQKTRQSELQALSDGLQTSLNSAEELLSMLLDMTKLESGVLQANMQHFPLNDVLASLVEEFSVIASQNQLSLHFVPTSVWVNSDRKLLRRIVQNLLSNAIRYTQTGHILLGVRRRKRYAEVWVADTGPGIAKSQQQEIFKEFHQLGHEGNENGLGLGLTIVERISHLLDHPIALRSELGRGTLFTVSIERVRAQKTNAVSISGVDEQKPILQGKQVLLIDNEPQLLAAMSKQLGDWGALVTAADSIDTALQKCQHCPDIMLLDFHLDHGQTGVMAAHQLRSHFSHPIPGIINSADPQEWVREQALEADLLFLPKPVKSAALKRMLRKALAH
ncbi:PAS domain-containing hybrid sensor histidine kinase/response regulator [Aestuariibacter salexigens]|uniref:PAS domain-containing hybrid sensor histidine kinase/response regulator n=1 Tax=Aestuariibacter salexigens TaxID=226010 RepID=UPI00041496A1|nr:PAS domain-containing hybrid sensor histidine kinase/response regulator [Aestuariibacter salexigens]